MNDSTNWTDAQRREVETRTTRNERRASIVYWMGRDISDAVVGSVRLFAQAQHCSIEEINRVTDRAYELVNDALRSIEYSHTQFGDRLRVMWADAVNECRKSFSGPDTQGCDPDDDFRLAMCELYDAMMANPRQLTVLLLHAESKAALGLQLLDDNLLADFSDVPAFDADELVAVGA